MKFLSLAVLVLSIAACMGAVSPDSIKRSTRQIEPTDCPEVCRVLLLTANLDCIGAPGDCAVTTCDLGGGNEGYICTFDGATTPVEDDDAVAAPASPAASPEASPEA